MDYMALMTAVLPLVSNLALTIAVPAFAVFFARWTGIQIEEKDQRAIHSALQSGATAALKNGPTAGFEVVKNAALAHLYRSAPDAIRRIPQATPDALKTIAGRYAAEAIAAAKKSG
jgi:translation elongation factor EF-G